MRGRALQLGEEVPLAKQLAEQAGVAYNEGILNLVKGQVQSAADDLELEARLAGSKKSPGQQAIDDAVIAMEKVRSEAASLAVRLLYNELEMMGVFIVAQIGVTANPERAKMSLLGRFRPSTVRRYLAYWQGFRKWVGQTYGKLPTSGEQLVDYLLAREEEGMGASVPLSVGKGVACFEKLGGFSQDTWMASNPLVEAVVRDLLRKLEEGAPPRRRAPRMLSAFIPALEKLVVSRAKPPMIRVGAWVKLLKIWGSLRFDDLAHMRQEALCSYDGKLSGLMKRTKTTGGGKRVKELPFHVSEHAWAVHEKWLTVGLEVLSRALGDTYELLVPAGCSRGAAVGDYIMSYQEAVAWSTEVMQELKDAGGNALIPHGWERFWTEHSERATLSSGLAALGVQKPERDLLGRWKPEGSDQYART